MKTLPNQARSLSFREPSPSLENLMTNMKLSLLIARIVAASPLVWLMACTQLPVPTEIVAKPPRASTCANIDWYEIGRIDGRSGQTLDRLNELQAKCDSTPNPVQVDLYTNGRDAGLVDFCSPTGGLEAGKSDKTYRDVCPENFAPAFLSNFELGKKIRELELENIDLEARIDDLTRLISPKQTGGSVRAQIETLKSRRAANNSAISNLENSAPSQATAF